MTKMRIIIGIIVILVLGVAIAGIVAFSMMV